MASCLPMAAQTHPASDEEPQETFQVDQQVKKHRKDCESALWAKSALFKVSFY